MAALTGIQRRAARKARGGAAMDMNLVSLIDVFTILIFFLLSSAAGVETLVSPSAVKLPLSSAEQAPKDSVVLVVSREEILVDGRRVALVKDALAQADDLIAPLKAELDLLATRKAVRAENASEAQAITIMADKEIPYRLLRKLMATCARANYSDVFFAVRRRDV
ncbi:Biopolymer transporter ExbD [Rubrivivax sp. A210]|uniref:ExbD/TolR family protein n=1 Tax=Rubrivivax sp. A210 TaxID=2772301 RepID=UPI00191ACACB|nr:biopolymer transporter ExbD [Rubrivivax sp. A210]CAD5374959.1 Biopolymer transporter ExbD [Rubrivivax sp. A210]